MGIEGSRLYDAVHDFMNRDFSKDVNEINRLIRQNKNISANLRSDIPPIPFSGDPWTKAKGNCVLSIGINPRAHNPGDNQYEKEIRASIELVKSHLNGGQSALRKYIDSRREYFHTVKYGAHFTFLENRYKEYWYSGEDVWQKRIQSMDIIPYFSNNAVAISNDSYVTQFNEHLALLDYRNIIEEMVDLIEPNWIHLNGVLPCDVFESAYASESYTMRGLDEKKGVCFGNCIIGNWEIPVLSHNFINYPSNSPAKIDDWKIIFPNWEDWLSAQQ